MEPLINFITDRFYGAHIESRMLSNAIDDYFTELYGQKACRAARRLVEAKLKALKDDLRKVEWS